MSGDTRTFLHYRDASGTDVIVDRLDDVPPAFRAQARPIDLSDRPVVSAPAPTFARTGLADIEVPSAPTAAKHDAAFVGGLHWPSVAIGFSGALVLALALSVAARRERPALRLALLALLAALGGFTYLQFVQQVVSPGATVATPASLVGEARTAADAARREQDDAAAAMRRIDANSR